jgi:hypothetical protein
MSFRIKALFRLVHGERAGPQTQSSTIGAWLRAGRNMFYGWCEHARGPEHALAATGERRGLIRLAHIHT